MAVEVEGLALLVRKGAVNDQGALRLLLPYFRPYRPLLVAWLAFLALSSMVPAGAWPVKHRLKRQGWWPARRTLLACSGQADGPSAGTSRGI